MWPSSATAIQSRVNYRRLQKHPINPINGDNRMSTRTLATFTALVCLWHLAVAHEYLREAPSFLKPCNIHGVQDVDCMTTAFQNVFTNWKNGVPGLKDLGSIDPFHVKKLRLTQRSENIANIHAELRNLLATGLSETKMLKSTISDKDYSFSFHVKVPSLRIESDYKLKGRILVLNLDTHGKMMSKLTDFDTIVKGKMVLKKVDDEYFFDVQSISSSLNSIGNFHIEFTNLLNGNRELEDSANQLLNDNWRDIFEIMRPGITQTLDRITFERYKKILGYIPARYFVSDLP